MKCLFELTEMRAKARKEWEQEKANAEKNILADTINFCENVISPRLEAIAKRPNGGGIYANFELGIGYDAYGNLILNPLVQEKTTYANGDASFCRDTGKCLSEAILEEYLTRHCLTVKWYDSWYKSYGCGSLKSKILYVSV